MRTRIVNLILGSMFLLVLVMASDALAAPTYKEKDGHVIPDFCQEGIDHPVMEDNVCTAVAYANSLWFFDATDWSGLVKHSNPPNWKTDSTSLIRELADLIYGNKSKKIPSYTCGGVTKYIKDKGMYYCQERNPALRHRDKAPTYDNYTSELDACEDVILGMRAYKQDGTIIDRKKWSHHVTGAGYDEVDGQKKIYVANPWSPCHDGATSPESTSFFDEIDITIEGGRMRSSDSDIMDGIKPTLQAAYIEIDDMSSISPKEKKTEITDGKICLPAGKAQYWYAIDNKEPEDIYEFAIEVEVPFDVSSITSPVGWQAEVLKPQDVPHLFAPPGTDEEYEWDPRWTGIRWHTDTHPVVFEETLAGFSFEYDDLYGVGSDTSLAALYCSTMDDDFTVYYATSGPVPDPSTLSLLALGGLAILRRRSKIR